LKQVGDISQLMGTQTYELIDGPGRGNRIIDVRSGSGLRYAISPDRCMDIAMAEYNGIPLCWRSSVGDITPHWYSAEGKAWLRSFSGGLLTTCGLTQFGSPNEDEGMRLGLHGRASTLCADRVNRREFWDQDTFVMEISGEMRETSAFAENVKLHRTLRTVGGSNCIELTDTVTNEGAGSVPHMLLYHFNFGFPAISPDAYIRTEGFDHPEKTDAPETETIRPANWHKLDAPGSSERDGVFYHACSGDRLGWRTSQIVNPNLLPGRNLVVSVAQRAEQLPHLYQWVMLQNGAYVVSLEPANCRGIHGRSEARKYGLPMLEPGQTAQYDVRFTVACTDR